MERINEGNGDDMDDGMQFCSIHPYRNSNNNNKHGGICGFCLQEKLDKLVSSSFPSPLHASSSSSSFRSDTGGGGGGGGNAAVEKKISVATGSDGIVFKRSKSTVAPRGSKFLYGFRSFLYLSSKKQDGKVGSITAPSPTTTAAAAKVSRSRSVGCGSRSFSGDFFERISTGFGDCTLRRVESQRESKPKAVTSSSSSSSSTTTMKEQVKCGRIFGGFVTTTSSSSSSYCVSSSTEDHINNKTTTTTGHGRSKSWGWTLASPMRAFTKPSSNKKNITNSNTTPNLSAIPSLLTVTS